MKLTVTPDRVHICRMGPEVETPKALLRPLEAGFISITRTEDELSLVARRDLLPAGAESEGPFCLLKVDGPLDFSLVGILSGLAQVLAEAKVSIFAISTYDTDYVLVREADLFRARSALEQAGHVIREG